MGPHSNQILETMVENCFKSALQCKQSWAQSVPVVSVQCPVVIAEFSAQCQRPPSSIYTLAAEAKLSHTALHCTTLLYAITLQYTTQHYNSSNIKLNITKLHNITLNFTNLHNVK